MVRSRRRGVSSTEDVVGLPQPQRVERQAGIGEQLPRPVGQQLGGRVVEDLVEVTMVPPGDDLASTISFNWSKSMTTPFASSGPPP